MAQGTKRKERKARQCPGPQPTPIEKQRRNRLMINLGDQELAELVKAAGGESAPVFARTIVLNYLARQRGKGMFSDEVRAHLEWKVLDFWQGVLQSMPPEMKQAALRRRPRKAAVELYQDYIDAARAKAPPDVAEALRYLEAPPLHFLSAVFPHEPELLVPRPRMRARRRRS